MKNKVKVIGSVTSTYLDSKGKLVAKIKSNREQANIDYVLLVLYFVEPPQHFSCLHVHKSESIYYDSLKNVVGRPFNESSLLRNIGKIEIRKPEFYQGADIVVVWWYFAIGIYFSINHMI